MSKAPPACLHAALAYLERGWSPIPLCPPGHQGVSGLHESQCKGPGKAPLWPWAKYQTERPSAKELALYWSRNPSCNVGVCMGPVSGLAGVDIDGVAGVQLLEEIVGDVPETLCFSTPGGPSRRRLLFVHPDCELPNRSLRVAGKEALRILAHGSQTVMPPSRHASGGTYQWLFEGAIAPFPAPLLAELLAGPTPPKADQPTANALAGQATATVRARAYLAKCDPCVSGQGGSPQAFKIACKLIHGFGLVIDSALALLMEPAGYNDRCLPPWSLKEWTHHLTNAAEKGYAPPMPDKHALAVAPHTNGSPNGKSPAAPPAPPKAHTRLFSAIAARPVDWLVPDWIPLGKLTVLDGDPGLGKSTLLLDVAARVTSHGIAFNNKQGPTGTVILLSAEDTPEDTIRPRLEAAGANLDRVIDLSHVSWDGKERPVEIPADLELIETVVREHAAKLLIIEPLLAYLAGPDANKDQEVRRVLYKLSKIGERHGCAVVTMRHLNKSSGGKAIYRGNMSIGVIGHARVGLLVAQDPDDDTKRVLSMVKINCGPMQTTLRFALEPVPSGVCRIGWCGHSSYKADDLVTTPLTDDQKEAKEEKHTKVQLAAEVLQEVLASGPLPVKQVKAELAAAGFTGMTVSRAAQKLNVELFYEMEAGARVYRWRLP